MNATCLVCKRRTDAKFFVYRNPGPSPVQVPHLAGETESTFYVPINGATCSNECFSEMRSNPREYLEQTRLLKSVVEEWLWAETVENETDVPKTVPVEFVQMTGIWGLGIAFDALYNMLIYDEIEEWNEEHAEVFDNFYDRFFSDDEFGQGDEDYAYECFAREYTFPKHLYVNVMQDIAERLSEQISQQTQSGGVVRESPREDPRPASLDTYWTTTGANILTDGRWIEFVSDLSDLREETNP